MITALESPVHHPVSAASAGACLHLQRKIIGGASDAHDTIDGAQVRGKSAVVRARSEDQLHQSLDGMGWFGGEVGPHGRFDVVEE